MDKYLKRLVHYTSFKILELPELKNTKSLSEELQKSKEAELIFKQISPADHIILMDEKGEELSSVQFADFLNKKIVSNVQQLVFVVAGPYGFDTSIYNRANGKLSFSKMTFSHQMIRLFFVEQLYRAFTILKGEPYHHK